MPETYFTFSPSWMQTTDGVKERLGVKPMSADEFIKAQEILKELNNPGYFEMVRNANDLAYRRQHGIVEQNPGIQTMGEAVPGSMYFIPGVGDALLAAEAGYHALNDNYGQAALAAGLLVAPSAVAGAKKSVSATVKPKLQAKTATQASKPLSEIELMAKEKANSVQVAVDNRKYASAGRKQDTSGAYRKRGDYSTTSREHMKQGKDAYGNRRGTQYHDIENYNLGYQWDPRVSVQGNANRLKKHLSTHHPDLVYHEESLLKYLQKNFPEQMKQAGYKKFGGYLYVNRIGAKILQ